ncbi:DNA-directed DNA polymerase I [Thermocladium modestius]|nr:DNA-directed DNA polymerase I [Thermocladium modestius]
MEEPEVEMEEEEERFRESEEEEEIQVTLVGETPSNSPPSMLLSVIYDGKSGKALAKLYDFVNDKIYFWYDNTGHRSYLLTDIPPREIIAKHKEIIGHKGFSHMEVVKKFDPLELKEKTFTKIYAKDPLSIGGRGNSIRERLQRTWEAKIKYHLSYMFDRGLVPGMFYRVENGRLVQVETAIPDEILKQGQLIYKDDKEFLAAFNEWLPLFQTPVPDLKRVAIDIEVFTPEENKIPNPKEAPYEIIAIGLAGSDGLRRVLVLRRKDMGLNDGDLNQFMSNDVEVMFFDSERELLKEFFKEMLMYPIVITFNGDNFDFTYIYNRALKLGFQKEEIPIVLTMNGEAKYILGIHIDLYKFFNSRAIETYAFNGKYKGGEKSLDIIASSLLGISKVAREKPISEMNYVELVNYNFRDALLTLHLTTYNNNLVMKLIVLMARISKTPIDDLVRSQVSAWIRNMLYFEHRRRGWLIPNKEDIQRAKGTTSTKAIIKGKKYLGAIVIDPVPGVFPNVQVLDFASLYPSIIKRWNLSYETVRCPEKEQEVNKPYPDMDHWVCMDRRGMTALLVGLLRDMRVQVYKRLAKTEQNPVLRDYYNVIQAALKVFINASYGVFGAEIFPLYCPPLAELVTALGRLSITSTLVRAMELGLSPIYGDTDSLFIFNPDKAKMEELINWVRDNLGIDIELDKTYRIIAMSSRKKNYAGILSDGSLDIKGLLGKKRNTPDFAKMAFNDVLKLFAKIESINDVQAVTGMIQEKVKEYYAKLKNKELPLNMLMIKVALSKGIEDYTANKPQHVKAALQLAPYGYKIGPGDIIFYVKTKTKEGVKPVQLARIDEIDVDKYVEYLESSLEQVLDALDIPFESIIGSKLF